jgi:hypothetical protein
MISSLLIAKITVTLVAVVGLSLIAEHVSPRIAGVLAGFPHGIAIVLYFIGVEQGADFAALAAVFAIGGLSANVFLAYVYHRFCRDTAWANLARATLSSVAGFLVFAACLRPLNLGPLAGALVTLAVLAAVRLLLRAEGGGGIVTKPRIRLGDVILRASLAAAIVLTITGLSGLVGPSWSGLLAGFPVVTFPLLLIIHRKHGPAPIATIVRNYPFGLTSLVVYTLAVSLAFPTWGMGWGTVAGFAAATVYLLVAGALAERWQARARAVIGPDQRSGRAG